MENVIQATLSDERALPGQVKRRASCVFPPEDRSGGDPEPGVPTVEKAAEAW